MSVLKYEISLWRNAIIARIYKDENVDVRIGTDGAASSGNGLNILAEARTAALVQRHDHWDATLLPAKDVIQMVTKGSKTG